MNMKKLLLLALVLVLIALFFLLDLGAYLNLEYFQSRRAELAGFTKEHLFLSSLGFFLAYVLITALSLPAAAVLTVAGGAVFGFLWALLLVSFASSIGATVAFLVARTVLRDWVQERFGGALNTINRGVEKDGAFYLFTLRLVPLFPFFLINVVMALTPIRTLTFYLVSQVGMLIGTALYVNVGVQLGQATSIPDILSADILLSLLAVALFPWLAKGLLALWRRRRLYRDFDRPRRFDANLVVIGAGSAGLVTSYIAALVKARVILVEGDKMGGDCLNTGCVPSKALIRSASVNHLIRRAEDFGLEEASARVNFPRVMDRVREAIARIEPHDSAQRYESLGVECLSGRARIVSPWRVRVGEREITTRAIVLATGARPAIPPIPGLDEVGYLTSETVWDLRELPGRLLVVGGGPIGCELAQAFARLGAQVCQLNRSERLLPREDEDAARLVQSRFEAEGIRLLNRSEIKGLERRGGERVAQVTQGERTVEIPFDQLLLATGRKANVEGLGLDVLDLPLSDAGGVAVNEQLQTRYPNIFACGDVAGPYQFTHMAAFQAWYAATNSLFGGWKTFAVDYSCVPWAIFTDPEVAHVGLNENEARRRGVKYEVVKFALDELDRAITDGEARGFVKVLTVPGKDRILGATLVGHHAGEQVGEFVTAMTHGLGLKKILATIHVYPTFAEANKHAAGEWRKGHAPQWLFPWLERYHRWRR